ILVSDWSSDVCSSDLKRTTNGPKEENCQSISITPCDEPRRNQRPAARRESRRSQPPKLTHGMWRMVVPGAWDVLGPQQPRSGKRSEERRVGKERRCRW